MPRPSGAGATRQPCWSRGIGEAGPDFWAVPEVSVLGAVVSASEGVLRIMVQPGRRPRLEKRTVRCGRASRRPPRPLGPALVATLGPGEWAPTLSLNAQFLAPAAPGELRGRGRVVRRGREIAFLAGELTGPGGEVVASATATAVIRRRTV